MDGGECHLLHVHVSTNMDAWCHRMDSPSAHIMRACHILVSSSVERSDSLSPPRVTGLSYNMGADPIAYFCPYVAQVTIITKISSHFITLMMNRTTVNPMQGTH